MRKTLSYLGSFILFVLLLAFYHYGRDPVRAFPESSLQAVNCSKKRTVYHSGLGFRTLYEVELSTRDLKGISYTLSLPEKIPESGLFCYLVIDGLELGERRLKLPEKMDNVALITYNYPRKLREAGENFIRKVFSCRKAALKVPLELLAIVCWASEESWSDGRAPSLVGFSLGALFIPVTYFLAEMKKISLSPGAIIYGGSNLYKLFCALPGSGVYKKLKAFFLAELFSPLDPGHYLKELKSPFLVVNGKYDLRVPYESAKELRDRLFSKEVLLLSKGHIESDGGELLQEISFTCLEWLKKRQELSPVFKDMMEESETNFSESPFGEKNGLQPLPQSLL